MKPRTKWQKRLTRRELRHLHETNATSLGRLRENLAAQARMRQGSDVEPCWTCRNIATKLGLDLKGSS